MNFLQFRNPLFLSNISNGFLCSFIELIHLLLKRSINFHLLNTHKWDDFCSICSFPFCLQTKHQFTDSLFSKEKLNEFSWCSFEPIILSQRISLKKRCWFRSPFWNSKPLKMKGVKRKNPESKVEGTFKIRGEFSRHKPALIWWISKWMPFFLNNQRDYWV